jgi:UDP-N-acetylglucosamine--N-acetylmuramyl-(pentapeptide) pyrophosphoryl-undecaprenol N-acetylglucosamine transferase
MKVLITGGHFSPAYSVIDELKKDNHEIVIVGRINPMEGQKSAESLEYQLSKQLHIHFIELSTGRLQRRISLHTIPSMIRFLSGVIQSFKILKQTSPDAVLTFGGYLALPVALAAKIKNIPVVTHEQTQGVGLSNKLIAKFSDAFCISFRSTQKYIKHNNVILTGNPMRNDIYVIKEKIEHEKDLPVIYVTGGSTGSHAINSAVYELIGELIKKYVVIHQTGENNYHDYEKMQHQYANLSESQKMRYIVTKYIYPSQIGYIYNSASLVISRSGANTVLELLALNLPSILIPLPHGQRGEQLKNAQLLQNLGLSEIIQQRELSPDRLMQKIDEMIKNKSKYTVKKDIIKKYVFNNAALNIVKVISTEYEKKKNHS